MAETKVGRKAAHWDDSSAGKKAVYLAAPRVSLLVARWVEMTAERLEPTKAVHLGGLMAGSMVRKKADWRASHSADALVGWRADRSAAWTVLRLVDRKVSQMVANWDVQRAVLMVHRWADRMVSLKAARMVLKKADRWADLRAGQTGDH